MRKRSLVQLRTTAAFDQGIQTQRRQTHPLPDATPRQLAFYAMNAHVLTNEFQYIKSSIDDIREDFESSLTSECF